MKSLMQEMVELLKKIESAEVAAERLIERAYDKGFDNGFEHGKESARQFDLDLKKSETDQEKRDRVVKRAKEFVDLHKSGKVGMKYEFIVNREKRTVVVLERGKHSDYLFGKGIAKCAPNDCFNRHIGEFIALHRALGLDVPQEYLDVPNPTEARVGNVVKGLNSGLTYKLVNLSKFQPNDNDQSFDVSESGRWVFGSQVQILDDSESEPNV